MNISLFLVCALVVCFQYEVSTHSARIQIRNGDDAKDGEFPYMVEIRAGTGCFICGGSIIASKWILTAGHCIDETFIGQSGNYTIVYGTKWLCDCLDSDDDPDTVINVKTLYRHPTWTSNFLSGIPSNDIGLLELEEDISFDAYAQPITLTDEDNEVPIGELGNLTGWGSSVSGDYPIVNLQKIQLPVLANEECSSRIDHLDDGDGLVFNGTQFFCTDDDDNGQCNGDSGSPYAINGTQYGIVSWSVKPCGRHPGVFSRVALPVHRQWIKSVTGV